jgi:dihydroorotate dehydrogenase (NAD+) catalytic subunit
MVLKPDLSVELSGLKLRNPVILSSGPLVEDGTQMRKAARLGAGAVMTRTMYLEPGKPLQWVVCAPESLMNTGGFSSLGLKPWVEREIKIAKEGGVPVIATIVNPKKNAAEVIEMASALETAGADMLVCATSAERDVLISSIKAAKEAAKIPVYVKMGIGDGFGELAKNIGVVGKDAEQAGADGIVAIDTMATATKIDVKTGEAVENSLEDKAWRLSGAAIHPLAIYCVSKLARSVKVPIIGVGGIRTGEDAIEMMMAGASAVGICTAAVLRGPRVLGKITKEMELFLARRKIRRASEVVGLALRKSP